MHLFIDTNIYLAFYHFSSDDLEELKKLLVLLGNKSLTLYTTQQVVDEYERNRENKIADALGRFREVKLSHQYPQLCQGYEEYQALRDLQKQFEKMHSSLVDKVQADIGARTLKADELLRALLGKATVLPRTSKILLAAKERSSLGNPPGKDDSLGDAINWELLLEHVPAATDLYFVSDDRDWVSALNEYELKHFLAQEWRSNKDSSIHYYRRLAGFFKEKFPQIKLASELEKEFAIRRLAKSSTFTATHAAVAKLAELAEFTSVQANEIVAAVLSNNQVGWIATDDDVHEFLEKIVEKHFTQFDPVDLEALKKLMNPPKPEPIADDSDEDIPF